jgi:two-component system phosphate regulon response regulator PhoB
MKQKILAVDDEADILKLLQYNLTNAGFEFISAEDGPEAIELANRSLPDLIILDLMLPNMDGNEVLKKLKAASETSGIPVLMLTAKGEEIDRILGLELGADDYIVKPFSPRELILRIKAVLRKGVASDEARLVKAGPIVIDTERFSVSVDGQKADFTASEFKLLLTLIKSKGRPMSRDALLARIGQTDTASGSRTIDTHIRRVRMKLGKFGDCIETARGHGYRFNLNLAEE